MVNTEEARKTRQLLHTEAGLDVMFGELNTIGPGEADSLSPRGYVASARTAITNALATVEALPHDQTRTEGAKHVLAKKVTEEAITKAVAAHKVLKGYSDALSAEAFREADSHFGPRAERAGLDADTRAWLREVRRKPTGLHDIKEAMAESDDVARVIYHTPRHLLGFDAEMHESLRFEALAKRRPDLAAKLDKAVALNEIAGRYERYIPRIRRSFYNEAFADAAAKSRVEG